MIARLGTTDAERAARIAQLGTTDSRNARLDAYTRVLYQEAAALVPTLKRQYQMTR